jgi:hypothetical protein
MATNTDRNRCAICNKEKATLRCGGCSKDFCFSHVADHRQELCKQLDEVEVIRDLFRQTLTEQTSQPQKHPLMQQIDKWERESIDKIQQTAKEARQLLIQYTTGHITEIEIQLNNLTDQLRKSREEDDFFETDLSRWKREITRLTEALNKPPTFSVRQNLTPLVTKIAVEVQNGMYAIYPYTDVSNDVVKVSVFPHFH